MTRRICMTIFLTLLAASLMQGCVVQDPTPAPEEPETTAARIVGCTWSTYGTSGSGAYPLEVCEIGDGDNLLLLTFGIHGWDDGFPGDGQLLSQAARTLADALACRETLDGWTVYVIPCANPDGMYDGTGNNGPGRCTTWLYADGESVFGDGLGIDMNRSFPYAFQSMTNSRNYNGTEPLQCEESRALAEFVETLDCSGRKIVVDVHGWEQTLFLADRDSSLAEAVCQVFPECVTGSIYKGPGSLQKGQGYFSAWCSYCLGWDGALLELPAGIDSPESFRQQDIGGRLLSLADAIMAAPIR